MSRASPESRIDDFIGKYAPHIALQVRGARAKLHTLFPRGYEMVYDNYNALVFGFGPTDRPSDAVLSIAAYPRWVTLFFLRGATLPDRHKLLKGGGNRVRSMVLTSAEDLDKPSTRQFITLAVKPLAAAFDRAPPLSTVVKSVSAERRARRPSAR